MIDSPDVVVNFSRLSGNRAWFCCRVVASHFSTCCARSSSFCLSYIQTFSQSRPSNMHQLIHYVKLTDVVWIEFTLLEITDQFDIWSARDCNQCTFRFVQASQLGSQRQGNDLSTCPNLFSRHRLLTKIILNRIMSGEWQGLGDWPSTLDSWVADCSFGCRGKSGRGMINWIYDGWLSKGWRPSCVG